MTNVLFPTAATRTAQLIDPRRATHVGMTADHYADVLGEQVPPAKKLGQRLMRTTFYSTGYQLLRPLGLRLAGGLRSPGRDADRIRIGEWLNLQPGVTVFDIGCGPGNFTGWFGAQVFPGGLAVGVDASHQMLHRAVSDNSGPSVAYLRADAEQLPFADNTADAATCLAALYLINNPFQALMELVRVLRPGGRVVILTSLSVDGASNSRHGKIIQRSSGVRMFGRDEITNFLRTAGFVNIQQHMEGLAQFVIAMKPSAS